jgi:hypothetical protein
VGKATSSQNAYRHGLRSASVIAPGEDPAEYTAFALEIVEDLQPVGIAQRLIAERIAQLQWKLRRVPEAEFVEFDTFRARHLREMQQATGKIKPPMQSGMLLAGNLKRMMTLQDYEMRIQRAIERLHYQLSQLQKQQSQRAAATPAPQATPAPRPATEPLIAPPQSPGVPTGTDANPSAPQQLRPDWVRSSGSDVPPPADPATGVSAGEHSP